MSDVISVIPRTSKDLITAEVLSLIQKTKDSLGEVKRFAVAEAWKILQLAVASVIQIIEALGNDLSSPDKKQLAMDLLSQFYDNVFNVVDIPIVPNIIEPLLHKVIKSFLMILVSSSIDALVTTFRNTGVFLKKNSNN
jgi:hypothetical protein